MCTMCIAFIADPGLARSNVFLVLPGSVDVLDSVIRQYFKINKIIIEINLSRIVHYTGKRNLEQSG